MSDLHSPWYIISVASEFFKRYPRNFSKKFAISLKSKSFSGCALFLKANEIFKSYACFWILWNCFQKEQKNCLNIKFWWLNYAAEIYDKNTILCENYTRKFYQGNHNITFFKHLFEVWYFPLVFSFSSN